MKRVFLLIVCILLSGCTVNYNLTIDDSKISEEISIDTDYVSSPGAEGSYDEQVYNFINNKDYLVYYGKKDYYEVTENKYGSSLNRIYKYTHKLDNFNEANLVIACIDSNDIEVTDEKITIDFNYLPNNCMGDGYYGDDDFYNNTKINIITNLKVLENNADEVNGNIYSWNYDSDEDVSKKVSIVIERNKIKGAAKKGIKDLTNVVNDIITTNPIIIFLVVIAIVGVIVYEVVQKKKEVSNRL